ncbi:unnamed protein product, partial [Brassica oleracea]
LGDRRWWELGLVVVFYLHNEQQWDLIGSDESSSITLVSSSVVSYLVLNP